MLRTVCLLILLAIGVNATNEKGFIGISLNGVNNYSLQMATGAMSVFNGTGYGIQIYSADFTAAKETANLQCFLDTNAAGLVILIDTIESSNALAPQYQAAGIPTGNTLWPIQDPELMKLYTGVAYLRNVMGGTMIGDYIKTIASPNAQVLIIEGVQGQGFTRDLNIGIFESLLLTGITVVQRTPGNYDSALSYQIVAEAFVKFPNLSVIIAYSASMSDGVAQYLSDNNKRNIIHVSSDCDEQMVKWMKAGFVTATRYFSAATTGKIGAQAVLDALENRPPKQFALIPQQMATQATIDAVIAADPFIIKEYEIPAQAAVASMSCSYPPPPSPPPSRTCAPKSAAIKYRWAPKANATVGVTCYVDSVNICPAGTVCYASPLTFRTEFLGQMNLQGQCLQTCTFQLPCASGSMCMINGAEISSSTDVGVCVFNYSPDMMKMTLLSMLSANRETLLEGAKEIRQKQRDVRRAKDLGQWPVKVG